MAVPPRLELALLPTPILRLERLSRRFGVELYLAFRGLLDTLGRDSNVLGQRVCFIRPGGLFSLVPLCDQLSRLIDGAASPRA